MWYYVACVIVVIYVVSAIMPRANYDILRVPNECRALNNAASQMYVTRSIMSRANYVIFYKYNLQLCHHVTRTIMPQANCAIMSLMICVVSAIMSRAKYALNTRYARKQNLKLRCTYLRCIFVLDFCRTIVLVTIFCRKVVFCRTLVFGHYFLAAKPSELTKCVKVVVAQEAWHVFDSNTHPGVSFSHVLIGRDLWGWEVQETNQIAPPGMDETFYWQKLQTHGFDWLS